MPGESQPPEDDLIFGSEDQREKSTGRDGDNQTPRISSSLERQRFDKKKRELMALSEQLRREAQKQQIIITQQQKAKYLEEWKVLASNMKLLEIVASMKQIGFDRLEEQFNKELLRVIILEAVSNLLAKIISSRGAKIPEVAAIINAKLSLKTSEEVKSMLNILSIMLKEQESSMYIVGLIKSLDLQ